MASSTAAQRAAQLWPILTNAAANEEILTYGRIADQVGGIARGMGKLFKRIEQLCIRENRPPLTVLVVQKKTGRPGHGFGAADCIQQARARVFAYDWTLRSPPHPFELD